jgi:hypothetical protein
MSLHQERPMSTPLDLSNNHPARDYKLHTTAVPLHSQMSLRQERPTSTPLDLSNNHPARDYKLHTTNTQAIGERGILQADN